ncbi:hypothetical protein EYF80_035519 [Liparis tanakae]|uniref:Uncharacterized protein n=1 Tax=Liparis tanakae TaxID=230148 RepID=A0A4Z2GM40_9TELE|nr:hypothetical protein EYF80_035519 [Liparis tanakae]
MSKPGGLFPVFRKSRNDATKPALDMYISSCLSYPVLQPLVVDSFAHHGGPGLRPSEGAEPTEPSDRAGSVPDKESVLSRASEEDRVPMARHQVWQKVREPPAVQPDVRRLVGFILIVFELVFLSVTLLRQCVGVPALLQQVEGAGLEELLGTGGAENGRLEASRTSSLARASRPGGQLGSRVVGSSRIGTHPHRRGLGLDEPELLGVHGGRELVGLQGVQVQSHGVVVGFSHAMAVGFIPLIPPVVTHDVIVGASTSPRSASALPGLHGVHSLLSGVVVVHLLLARPRPPGAARLVVLRAEHVFHSWEEGAVLILKEGVREADRSQGHKAVALLILVRLLHRADGVKLVLLGALLVQLALLGGELGGQRLLLVGLRLLVRVVGVALMLSAGVLLLGVVLGQMVHRRRHGALLALALLVLVRRGAVVVVRRRHLQGLRLELQLQLRGLGLGLTLVLTGAERPASAFHDGLLLADRVLLLGVGVHFMVLLVLRVGVHLRVLLMWLMGVHLVVLLVLLMRVHLVVLLVLLVRVHLVVLLQLAAGGVRQHGLQQVRRLAGLIGGGVHEGAGRLRLGMLLLDFRCFPGVRDFGALLRLLLQLHLSVRRYLGVRGHVLTV